MGIRKSFEKDKSDKKKLEESDLRDALYSIIEMANVCDYTSTELMLNELDNYAMTEEIEAKMKNIRALLDKLDYKGVAAAAQAML